MKKNVKTLLLILLFLNRAYSATGVTAAVAAISPASSTLTVIANPYGNYAFSDQVTLNTTSLGITSNLTSFPALLMIQDNNLIISGACTDKVYYPNGPNYDFAFYDPTTSAECYYQIESYNQTTGTLLVWVQVPTLTYATNKSITFYYGSKTPPITHNTAFYQNTWASDYKGVFHFNESSYTGSVTDGTAGGNTGTTSGMTSSNLVAGKIGNAYQFSGAQKISYGAITVTGTFTISAWVNLSVINKDQKVMTNQTGAGSASGGYKMGVYINNYPEIESGTALNRGSLPLPATFATGSWHYVQGVYSGTTLSTYVDGAQYEVLITTTNPSSTNPFYIGVGEGGTQFYFNGIIDEARVSNVAKTSDWVKAEYVDQNNPATFTSVGSTSVNSTNAAAIPGDLTYTWTGSTSTDPTVATNWNNTTAGATNQLPAFDGSASLVIPAGLTNYPSLTASESIYGLTIGNGATLNLNGYTLSVGCNIYNSSTGRILYGSNTNSGITWNGSASTQTYTGSTTSSMAQLGNMTINNSAGGTITISGGPLDIFNLLTITNGNLAVGVSPAALTLKSSSTLSASVTALPSTSSITGNVSVERYISGGSNAYRGYRLLSSPVYTVKSGSNYYYDLSYLPLYAPVTGTNGTAGGLSKAGNPSMYLYRDNIAYSDATFNSGNFRGINTINNSPLYNIGIDLDGNFNLHAGTGVFFFYRGNLTNVATKYLTGTSAEANVFVSTGTLNQQAVTVTNWYTQLPTLQFSTVQGNAGYSGFNLVGNPYASSIDWSTFSTTNAAAGIYGPGVGTTIYIFNEVSKLYATYNLGMSTNGGSNIISSGQGFFVKATASGASLTFNESAKTNSQVTGPTQTTNPTLLLDALPVTTVTSPQYLRLQLQADSINKDESIIRFDNNAKDNFVFNEDSQYFPGSGIISLSNATSDNIPVSINVVPYPKKTKTIKLNVGAVRNGTYGLNMAEVKNVPKMFDVWLIDKYKKDSTDLRKNLTYSFNVTVSDTNSFGRGRFSLVIRTNPALDLKLLNYTAIKTSGGSQLLWKTLNESNYTNFTIERSIDGGKTYTTLQSSLSNNVGSYLYLDANPVKGLNTYRVKVTDVSDSIIYTSAIPIMYSNTSGNLVNNNVSLYPNPAVNLINISIVQNNLVAAGSNNLSYDIKVMNNSGAIIKAATLLQASWQYDVSSLLPGTYIIEVINNNDKSLIGKGKFVKL